MMTKSEELVQLIRDENIVPTSKWYYTLKSASSLLFYVSFLLIGAISFSVILFSIQQADFALFDHIGHSKLEFLLSMMPIIWLLSLIFFIVGSIYAIYKSDKGYKFVFSKIIGLTVGLSMLLGTLFFISGGAGWFEEAFAMRVGFYESIQSKKEKLWVDPLQGKLGGIIQAIDGDNISIVDFEGNTWQVDTKDAFIPPSVFLEKDSKIKMVGKKGEEGFFIAEQLMPWGGEGQRRKMMERFKNIK